MSGQEFQLKQRDRIILGEYSNDPTLSARELRDILEKDHGISVSRVTVSESLRKMREEDLFREAVIPNEEYLFFSLFEYQFFPPNFNDNWREALEHIKQSDHTLLFWLSDGMYQWRSVMIFRNREQESRWIHEFYKSHGELVVNLNNSVVTNVLKFDTSPAIFQDMLGKQTL